MSTACIGQPLSWLTLERHALAELDAPAAATTRAHLGDCAACRAAYGTITADRRALPPLPDLPAAAPSRAWYRRPQPLAVAGALLAAAALLLMLVRKPDDTRRPRTVRVKGAGLVSFSLVRERAGLITFDPPDVRDTDRWKVQLSCAPGGAAAVEILVRQPGQPAARPLAAQRFRCGNNIVLPGAFHITGGAATICARFPGDGVNFDNFGPEICATVRP